MTEESTGVGAGEVAAPEDEYARRLAEVESIRAAGGEPYPVRFDRDRTARPSTTSSPPSSPAARPASPSRSPAASC